MSHHKILSCRPRINDSGAAAVFPALHKLVSSLSCYLLFCNDAIARTASHGSRDGIGKLVLIAIFGALIWLFATSEGEKVRAAFFLALLVCVPLLSAFVFFSVDESAVGLVFLALAVGLAYWLFKPGRK